MGATGSWLFGSVGAVGSMFGGGLRRISAGSGGRVVRPGGSKGTIHICISLTGVLKFKKKCAKSAMQSTTQHQAHSRRNSPTQAMTKYRIPAGKTHFKLTSFQSQRRSVLAHLNLGFRCVSGRCMR